MVKQQRGVKNFTSEGSDDISLSSEAWNVAEGYTKIKILRLLILLDKYDTIAQFGTEEVDQDIMLNENQLAKRRIEAISRFISVMKQLMGNVRFALRRGDIKKITDYTRRINQVEEVAEGIFSVSTNDLTKEEEVIIDEEHFRICLKVLQSVKDELNFQINSAGLIFKVSDEMDLDKIMGDIVSGG